MKPLSITLIFLIIAVMITMMNDTQQDMYDANEKVARQYEHHFQAAVADAGAYLNMLEAQQITRNVRYQREKQLSVDQEVLDVFYANLALKLGIETDSIAIQNLKLHMPAMVLVHYDGYVLITNQDLLNVNGTQELSPVFWPKRPFVYELSNGNLLYFKMDDKAEVYDVSQNVFLSGNREELCLITDLSPLLTEEQFHQQRLHTITDAIETDLSGAINRHLELSKRMGLAVQFTLPRGWNEQSINHVGLLSFIQGYPLPSGELFDSFAFGGNSIYLRNQYIGTVDSTGELVAYKQGCLPSSGVTIKQNFYEPEEAVKKGYYIQDCSPFQ
ncbi:hypothetical protein [Longirhabdus pacifica]|uniref:hypothetical protein n=1 Tax=Longirhabdus pacifica TaxID=2305227 RepID=UPI00100936AA|nr:hypothetical protein [Longirhabdus pacifica]